ncbi:hypothetical protein AMECASPLE_030368 [Ameca splendens]|uniref:Uncharacterized protein n=1 Tax=Ameca splendens TaxID=208324 RepID=A0ABV0YTH0_9TELE
MFLDKRYILSLCILLLPLGYPVLPPLSSASHFHGLPVAALLYCSPCVFPFLLSLLTFFPHSFSSSYYTSNFLLSSWISSSCLSHVAHIIEKTLEILRRNLLTS